MPIVTIECNRCKCLVDGIETEFGTSGFYKRNKYWEKFFEKDEEIVCDQCIWNSESYQNYLRGKV